MRSPIIIVQARMNSSRLPGKVLRQVAGEPLLGYVLDRIERAAADMPIFVATSRESGDDPIAAFCSVRGTACLRGPLDDVAGRFVQALDETGANAFVRITADSPLIDQALIRRAIGLFAESGADLATNVKRRTFPKGMSVEAVDAAAFRRLYAAMQDPADREHVTRAFYRNPGEWQIAEFTSGRDLGAINLSVDTEADFATFAAIVARMDAPHWSYGLDDVLVLANAVDVASA